MTDDEIDFTQAKPAKSNVEKVVEKFTSEPVHIPADVDALVDALAEDKLIREYPELSEDMLAEYHHVDLLEEEAAARKKVLREQMIHYLGRERGLVIRGAYAVDAKEVKGRLTVKWEKAVKECLLDQFGKDWEKTFHPYWQKNMSEGEPTLRIEVKKIGPGEKA